MRHQRANSYLVGLSSILPKFNSELFEVQWITANNGKHTVIKVLRCSDIIINIEGHHEMLSDNDCIEQMQVEDLSAYITYVRAEGFRKGDMHRSAEIRKSLGICDRL